MIHLINKKEYTVNKLKILMRQVKITWLIGANIISLAAKNSLSKLIKMINKCIVSDVMIITKD